MVCGRPFSASEKSSFVRPRINSPFLARTVAKTLTTLTSVEKDGVSWPLTRGHGQNNATVPSTKRRLPQPPWRNWLRIAIRVRVVWRRGKMPSDPGGRGLLFFSFLLPTGQTRLVLWRQLFLLYIRGGFWLPDYLWFGHRWGAFLGCGSRCVIRFEGGLLLACLFICHKP